MSAQGASPILNPDIYLNYLTPLVARNYEASRDLDLAFLGILGWDIFSSIPDDYRLVRSGRISFVLFAYFLARLTALVMAVLSVLLKSGSVSDCRVISIVLAIFQIISTAAASYLFLVRVHAVYHASKSVRHIFSFLWLVCVGVTFLALPDSLNDYAEIADTKHCIRARSWSPLGVAYTSPVYFDMAVYFAISHKIFSTHGKSERKRWFSFRWTKALPRFSRAIVQGGQQYYLITNAINMTRFNLSLQSNATPTLQVMLSTPAVVVTSIMACRVHRNLFIETLHDSSNDSMSAPKFAHPGAVNLPFSENTESRLTEVESGGQGKGGAP